MYAQVHAAVTVENYVENDQKREQDVNGLDGSHILGVADDEPVREALEIAHNHQERRGYCAGVGGV